MAKAIFLDRDGTINVEKNYLYQIEEFEFLPGVIEALQKFQELGYLLIIVTNQSGIARGYYAEEEFQKLNMWMLDTLKKYGIDITKVYYCPHLPDAQIEQYRKICDCRKPALGMYEQAIAEYEINLSQSYAIGDKLRDLEICKRTECRGYLVGFGEDIDVISNIKSEEYKGIKYKESLLACLEDMEMEGYQ